MHKDELLELHEYMVEIKNHYQSREGTEEGLFDPYEQLGVEPTHVHKSKSEHKHAIFVLGNALASAMSDDEFSEAGRVGKRMEELAEDAQSDL